MRTRSSQLWVVALSLSLMQIWCRGSCSRISSNFQSQADFADDDLEKEGKMWPWAHKQQQQPQTNLIIITRPTASAFNAPISALPAAIVNVQGNPITATGTGTVGTTGTLTTPPLVNTRYMSNRYAANRFRGNRRRPLRRGNTRPWNHRRYYYGREDEETQAGDEQQNFNADEENLEENVEGVYKGVGVNTKLDIEQLGKSEPNSAAGWIVVDSDDMSKITSKQKQNKRRRRLKPKTPQTTAIFASTMPTITATIPTTNKASKQPAYVATGATLTVTEDNVNKNSNNNNNQENNSQRRKTIWQNLSERWRKYRQRQSDVKMDNDKDMLVMSETEPIRIKNKRKKNKRKQQQNPQQIKQEQTFNNDENESSLINANNTNSHFHNIMNAFRRNTPTNYLKQH